MDTILILAGLVVVIALVFDFTNGFHDAANAIATAISTENRLAGGRGNVPGGIPVGYGSGENYR